MNRVNSIAVDARQLTSVEVISITASVHDRYAKRSCWRSWGDREFGNDAETTGRADDNNRLWIVVAVLLAVYGILRIAGLVSLRTSGIRWLISPVRVRGKANDPSAVFALADRHNLIAVAGPTQHLARGSFQRPLLGNTLPGVLGLQLGFNHRVGGHFSATGVQLGRNRGAA